MRQALVYIGNILKAVGEQSAYKIAQSLHIAEYWIIFKPAESICYSLFVLIHSK